MEEIRKESRRRSFAKPGGLIEFIRYFWDVLEPTTPFVDGNALRAICEHLEAVSAGKIRRLLINVPPGFAKALDCDTPVLTTWGWKRHGDLKPGDFIFGPDGKPKRVIAATVPVVEPSFTVTFDDGAQVIAGAGHQWQVERDYAYGSPKWTRCRKTEVVTTPNLIASVKDRPIQRPDRIALAAPIEMGTKRLLIEPYILGAWLGDGATNSGVIYTAQQDVDHFSKFGYQTKQMPKTMEGRQNFYQVTVENLCTRLRMSGLLGNKHIPDDYLESSIEQRWELVRGLMDTDGTANKNGHCSYVTKLKLLAEQIVTLLCSLGIKAHMGETWSVNSGVRFGPYYQIVFTAPTGTRIFDLVRKQERVKFAESSRAKGRYVTAVEAVGDRLVNCIQVEGELYLCGKNFVTTHNSLIVNVFWPAWEWSTIGAHIRYVSFSYSAHLTTRDNEKFRDLILSQKYHTHYGDRFKLVKIGSEKVQSDKTGWKFASSVGGVGTGERGDRILCDDGHNVREAESDAVREMTVQWFREAMQNRLNDLHLGVIIVIMQRVNEGDISGVIIEHYPDYVHLCIPMRFEADRACSTAIGWCDWREHDGELAWPERYPDSVLKPFESMPYLWAGQYQQRPEPRGGGIIKREYWKLWDADAMRANDVKPGMYPAFDYIIAAFDGAMGQKQENDWSALTVWGTWVETDEMQRVMEQFGTPSIMLIAAWRKKLTLHGRSDLTQVHGETKAEFEQRKKDNWGLVEHIADTCRRLKVNKLLIEAKANGHDIANEMRRLYARDDWMVVLDDPGQFDKTARVYSIQHFFADGRVWRPDTDWAEMVETEFAQFPKGANDDLVDSGVMTLRHLRRMGLLVRADESHAAAEEIAFPSAPKVKWIGYET